MQPGQLWLTCPSESFLPGLPFSRTTADMLAPLVSEISGRWQAVLQTARAAEVFNLALGGEDRFQGCSLRVLATVTPPVGVVLTQ